MLEILAMRKTFIVFLLLAFPLCVFAEVPENQPGPPEQSTKEKITEALNTGKDQVVQALSQSRNIRENSKYFVTASFAPIDFILPSKLGLTWGLVNDVDHTAELEYLKSSVSVPFVIEDIGSMTDERLSYIRRSYLGSETFNLSYGLTYFRFKVHIGNKYLATVSPNVPDVDLIRVDSLGFNVGFGNRWIFSNRWIVGVDWLSWSQPVVSLTRFNKFQDYTTDQGYKDTTETVEKIISWVPRISVLKLQAGYSF